MKKYTVTSVAILLLLVSCTTASFAGLQMYRRGVAGSPPHDVVGTFEEQFKVFKFFGNPGGWSLFNIGAAKVPLKTEKKLMEQVAQYGGDGVVDLTIGYKANFLDFLLAGITLGIVTPSTVTIQGSVVKLHNSDN